MENTACSRSTHGLVQCKRHRTPPPVHHYLAPTATGPRPVDQDKPTGGCARPRAALYLRPSRFILAGSPPRPPARRTARSRAEQTTQPTVY